MAAQRLAREVASNRDGRSLTEMRPEVVRSRRIDKAIEMLLSDPIATWELLKKYGLSESDFWHLSYLVDNTISVSPTISIPTLSELENLARRARYVATTEPTRLSVPDLDPDTGKWIEDPFEFPALDPDYVQADAFLDDDPLILCIKTGNTPTKLIDEFKLFIQNHGSPTSASSGNWASRRRTRGQNPNKLNTAKIADLYVLAYIDLRIFTTWEQMDFYGPGEMASIIGEKDINDYKVSKRIAWLADQLLDNDSRLSQELLNLAAIHRNAQKLSQSPAKRGWRTNRKRPQSGSK